MYQNIEKYVCLVVLLVCAASYVIAQTITINGYIKDASSQEALIERTLYETTTKGATSFFLHN
jgi:hypothetical protein